MLIDIPVGLISFVVKVALYEQLDYSVCYAMLGGGEGSVLVIALSLNNVMSCRCVIGKKHWMHFIRTSLTRVSMQ